MRDNTTGTHNDGDYFIGKGKLYFAEHDPNGRAKGYSFLGNAPDFAISVTPENYKHKSSQSGLSVTDLDIPISLDTEISFTLEALHLDNLALFFSGTKGSENVGTQAGEAAMVAMQGAGVGQISGGKSFNIQKLVGSTLTRYPGMLAASDLVVELYDGALSDTLTLGTDYTVNLEFGTVFLISDAAKILAIDSGDDRLRFTLAAQAGAPSTIIKITGMATPAKKGSIKLVSENANSGDGVFGRFSEVNVWNVTLKPNGELNLISDEAAQMQFTATATANAYDGRTLDILTNAA